MLVTNSTAPTLPRQWFTVRRLGVGLMLAALLSVAPYLFSGTELVRLRNALSLGPDLQLSQDWTPPAVPFGYLQERVAPDPYFVDLAQRLGLAALPDDWARGVAISRHLLGSAPVLMGGPIQKDLRNTYKDIVQRGDGYCGDFVRAYLALAGASGMTVRTWAFSFDGFGGHGHIWVELWNRQAQRWQLQDVFNNYYFVDRPEEPLSALALRQALQSKSATLQMRPLHPGARPGYEIEAKAWDYLQRGLNQWYLVWGNNVFSQDDVWAVRTFSGVSRMAEGLGSLVSGQQPEVRLLPTASNQGERTALHNLQWRLFVMGAAAAAGLLLVLVSPWVGRHRTAASTVLASSGWPPVCIVGPLPPPSGGMANQCEQLLRLLQAEGVQAELVRTNAPYRPALVGHIPVLRAGFRMLPYLVALWRGVGRAQVVHVLANSGWAWHLLAAPALLMARWRGVPAIVNYRGGQADEFFARSPRFVLRLLAGASQRVTPSAFLLRVFRKHGLGAEVIPNIIDLSRFKPGAVRPLQGPLHLIVTRNLEAIYDIPTALQAFALVRAQHPSAKLTVAGSGPDLTALRELAARLGLADAVDFAGRIENADIGRLYASADVMLNPSTADNMPISILEALACGVPVVTTSAGGIPDLVEDGRTALLVPVGNHQAMAQAVLRLVADPELKGRLRQQGVQEVARYAWPQVRDQWLSAYRRAASKGGNFSSNGPVPTVPR